MPSLEGGRRAAGRGRSERGGSERHLAYHGPWLRFAEGTSDTRRQYGASHGSDQADEARPSLHLECNAGTVEGMSTRTIGFAVAEEDEPRLERLTQRFGHGNRSAFLREAMHQMEVVDRAGRLAELQAYGVERSAAVGLSHEDAVQVVRRALRRR